MWLCFRYKQQMRFYDCLSVIFGDRFPDFWLEIRVNHLQCMCARVFVFLFRINVAHSTIYLLWSLWPLAMRCCIQWTFPSFALVLFRHWFGAIVSTIQAIYELSLLQLHWICVRIFVNSKFLQHTKILWNRWCTSSESINKQKKNINFYFCSVPFCILFLTKKNLIIIVI